MVRLMTENFETVCYVLLLCTCRTHLKCHTVIAYGCYLNTIMVGHAYAKCGEGMSRNMCLRSSKEPSH